MSQHKDIAEIYKQDYCMEEVCCNPSILLSIVVLPPVAGKSNFREIIAKQQQQEVSIICDLPQQSTWLSLAKLLWRGDNVLFTMSKVDRMRHLYLEFQ